MTTGDVDVDVRPLRERLDDLALGSVAVGEANERLHRARLTDGLPVVPPLPGAVAAMLAGADAAAAATSRPVPPGFVVPTLWDVAACAVLAGCPPGVLALVVAALEAAVQPELNLLGVQTTTGAAAPFVIVHGPVVEQLGLNCGTGALGPGWRANAGVGRAVRLVLQDVGLSLPGDGDMATHGHPGKYTWLVAEHRAASPWASLAASRRLPPEASAVTVVACVGNVEVVLPTTSPAAVVEVLGLAVGGRRPAVVLLPPESARYLAGHGWTHDRLQRDLAAGTGDADDLVLVVTGGPGVKATFLPGWGGGTRPVTRVVHPLGGGA